MKKLRPLVLFLGMLGMFPFSAYLQDNQMENIQYISQPNDGVMQVHSTGYGKNEKVCVEEAQKNAFKVLMFRGVPGSPVPAPIIPGDITGSNMDKTTRAFFTDGTYKKFISRIVQFSSKERTKFGKRVVVDMDIEYKALLAYLEQAGIIRKFGY